MRFLHILGKFLISVGVGILLFVGWTLKGTDLYTNAQQDRLAEAFELSGPLEPEVTGGSLRFLGPPRNFSPGPGDVVFRLVIPAIDTDHYVVEGVGTEELRKGPGHYPQCREGFEEPLCTEFEEIFPGEKGRVIVSGHRTTYGAPFYGVDRLEVGDEIRVISKWGRFTYEVTEQEVVPPDSLAITIPSTRAELVLTTCNPRYSASERLIVYSELVEVEEA